MYCNLPKTFVLQREQNRQQDGISQHLRNALLGTIIPQNQSFTFYFIVGKEASVSALKKGFNSRLHHKKLARRKIVIFVVVLLRSFDV